MKMKTRAALWLMLVMAFAARAAENRSVSYQTRAYKFSYDLDAGRWDLEDGRGRPIIKNAFAAATLIGPGMRTERVVTSAASSKINFEQRSFTDRLGSGIEFKIKCPFDGVTLANVFRFYDGKTFFTAGLELSDVGPAYQGLKVKMLEPVKVEGPEGGLFIGKNPGRHKILDNGSNWYLDFIVNLYPGRSRPPFPANVFSANSRSDWSMVLYDPESKRSALFGFLTSDRAGNIILAGYDAKNSRLERGRGGFSAFAGQSIYRPAQAVKDGFSSEILYLDFSAASPFDALENYADAIAAWNEIRVWQGPTPDGWNSWGEYIHDLDEETILKNLEFAAARFKPFGMNYFQIDDGYQPHWGDWEAAPARFPRGMKWMADQVRGKGMVPGIWIAPFEADVNSEIYQRHPDWFLPMTGLLPNFLVSKNLRVLDLSKPEVQDHLRQVVRKYVKDWGYKWIKVDFVYYALAYSRIGDGSQTVFELYRQGMRIIKEEAGEDAFVLGIGIVPVNYGIVDGMRLGLDNMPVWNNRKSGFVAKDFSFAQGLVPTARVIARRYWMNYRIWINHPDLIFFNNDRRIQMKVPPLTFDEALCFVNLVAMSGGIVKIGDKLADMTDAEVNAINKILPVYKKSGRPLDLFEKATPEIWHLPVSANFEQWDVLGLFNWGENWTGNRKTPAKTRTISVKISDLGLDPGKKYLAFDFWNEKFLGEVEDELGVLLKPRSSAIIALRELKGHPIFLSYNRHFTQGAIEIKNISWDPEARTLAGVQAAVPGFEYRLYFYRPEDFTLDKATVSNATFHVEQEANLAKLVFTTATPGPLNWKLSF